MNSTVIVKISIDSLPRQQVTRCLGAVSIDKLDSDFDVLASTPEMELAQEFKKLDLQKDELLTE